MSRLRGVIILGYFLGLSSFRVASISLRNKDRKEAQLVFQKHAIRALIIGKLTVKLGGTEHLPLRAVF